MASIFDSIMETKRPDTSESSNASPLRETYRGIPTNDKSKMWDYSVEEGEDGQRILSFLVDDSVVNFKLNQPKNQGENISVMRLPDADRADFGARGNATKGRFQVHKSGPSSIYGTIHGGKKTMTFGLENTDPTNHDWVMTAKNSPITDVAALVKSVSIKDKTAFQVPTMEQLTAPLTASYPVAMGLSALLGAGGMATYHIGNKVLKRLRGEDTSEDRPLWQDMLLGAGGGALASGAFKAFGENDKELGRHAPRFNHHRLQNQPMVFSTPENLKPAPVVATHGVSNSVQPKVASMEKKAQGVDVGHVQNLLSYDQTLTPADRRILISQLEQAAKMSPNGEIDMNRIRNSGLGMLVGYITAKLMGFGLPGQIGTAALGGFIGANSTQSGGKQWDSRGFYHY